VHIHDSALQALILFAMVLLIGTTWRLIAMHLHDKPVGKAMGVMY
jgi:hypothetical protein